MEKGGGVEDMLQGTYTMDTEGLDEVSASSEMKSFIKALQTPLSAKTGKRVPTMQTDMTVADSTDIFKKTRESTASSPSGIHYSYYIAACESSYRG